MFRASIEEFLEAREEELAGQVQLVFFSPPFPLNRKKKYGNLAGDEYLSWLGELAATAGADAHRRIGRFKCVPAICVSQPSSASVAGALGHDPANPGEGLVHTRVVDVSNRSPASHEQQGATEVQQGDGGPTPARQLQRWEAPVGVRDLP